MEPDRNLQEYAPLIEDTVAAMREDFRIVESIAQTAGGLLARRKAKSEARQLASDAAIAV